LQAVSSASLVLPAGFGQHEPLPNTDTQPQTYRSETLLSNTLVKQESLTAHFFGGPQMVVYFQ
jgi:hypothetical protein